MKSLYLALLCAVPLGAMDKQESKSEKYVALAAVTATASALTWTASTSVIKGGCTALGWPLTIAVLGGVMATDLLVTSYMSNDHIDYIITAKKN